MFSQRTVFCLCALVLFPLAAPAGGPVHGAKAAGMGTAFIAVADDPSALLHNPGGLTQLKGTQIYNGVTGVVIETGYSGAAGSEDTDFQIFAPPHAYLTTDFGSKDWVVAFGIHSPFGIGGRKWSDTGALRYSATENGIATLAFNPTLAWQADEKLSVALGIDYLIARTQARRRIDQSLFGSGDADSRLEGEGGGWGYNLGLLYRVNERFRLGCAFRSGIEVDIDGEARIKAIAPALQPLFGGERFKTDADTRIDFPEIYSIGLAFDPTPDWTLALDIEWVLWSSFEKVRTDFAAEVPAAGVVDGSVPLNWKDSRQIKFGVDWRLNNNLSLRGGYAFIPTPVPSQTLEAGNPDADSHNFHLGLGYRWGDWFLDGAYALGIYEDRAVDNPAVSGKFENTAHFLALSLGRTF